MKKFILNTVLFIAPIMLPVFSYFIADPFKVLYNYTEYFITDKDYQIQWNRDFQSTKLYLDNYEKQKYNSFIFGNSRSFFYQIKTWNKFVKGNCFHFNAAGESIYGINCKLNFLNELNVDIKNAIIVIDASTLIQTKNSTQLFSVKHPRISKESYFDFHLMMFYGYFPKAFLAYFDLYLTGKRKPYMQEFGITKNIWKHDVISNQLKYYVYDQQILTKPDLYFTDKMSLFYKRDTVQSHSAPIIKEEQQLQLKNIISVLKAHKTNYKVIINPLYDQLKLNPEDLIYLQAIFGSENVYDFSGINSFTNDFHNYYENSHYRPFICDSILNRIYK